MTCLLSQELLSRTNEAGGTLLLDLILGNEVSLLRLDDLRARPGAGFRRSVGIFSLAM
jgi:hypothetical protein